MSVPVYLFAVQCTSTTQDRWDVKPLLFCVGADGRRYTLWLQDYEAHVLLFPETADLQVADVEQYVDEARLTAVTRVDTCVKTPVVGFTNGRTDTLIRVHYRDLGARYRLRRALEDLDALVLHRSYSAEMLLLHITGLRLQTWYSWDGCGIVVHPSFVDQGPALRVARRSLCSLTAHPTIAPLSYACVRLSLRSSTAMPSNLFLPDHTIERDAIEACELILGRLDRDETQSFGLVAGDERELLQQICAWFREHSPCIVVHMSDPLDHVAYLHFRAVRHRVSSGLSALLRAPCVEHQFPEDKRFRDIGMPGRESVDVLHILQKFMTSPPLDGFSIADAFAHPKLLRDKGALPYSGDEADMTMASAGMRREHARKELHVIDALQRDNAFLLNHLALSASCGLPLFNIVSRGQQKRAFAVFAQAYHDAGLYINHSEFERPYVVVPRPRAESSFPDPPWIDNAPLAALRTGGTSARARAPPAKKRRSVLSLLGREKSAGSEKGAKPATQKRYGGGFVLHPEPGFYAEPWQAVCTMDFASLYPSIMEGYRTCYMRVCYDPAWLDDPRAEKQYIPLDEQHCCVLITRYDGEPVRSITDRIVGDVVQNRKRVRAQMKTATDKFSLQSLNGTQLSMKVLQNAFYGACGSETFGVPCTALAASVCTIGQWMNKTIRHRAMLRGCRCVYGDTDSIFVQFPTDPALVSRDEILADIYRQASELEQETTRIFPPPNAVEFETLKLPHLQTSKKKLYAAREYPPTPRGWAGEPTELFKGYCFKKRDRCPFVQRLCREFIQKLLDARADDDAMLAWYERAVRATFVARPGADALSEFVITCRLNDSYKNEEALALALASTYEKETGTRPRPGSRLKFVVGDFRDERKHAESALTPATFLRKGHRLSAAYYLEKQLLLPLVQILDLRPALLARIRRATERIRVRITSRSSSLEAMLQGASVPFIQTGCKNSSCDLASRPNETSTPN